MKIKTSELSDTALDWAVAKAFWGDVHIATFGPVFSKGFKAPCVQDRLIRFAPSTDPAQAWPIIEREAHNLFKHNGGTEWCCACNVQREGYVAIVTADGPTPLIAASALAVIKAKGIET